MQRGSDIKRLMLMFMEKDNKEKTKPATTQMVPVSSESLDLARMSRDINTHLADESVKRILLATTFKGLEPVVMKQAIMEGMIRGFNFKNFLEKDVYAIPFGKSYSITQSIDYIRKIGMRAGIVGKSAPEYTYEENKKVESCTITVKRKIDNYIGEYSATVYFNEFSTGRNLWATKPRMMLAKVAEMHALRMACPEVLAHAYIEEEMEKEVIVENEKARVLDAKVEGEINKMGKFLKKNETKKDKNEVQAPESDEDTTYLEGLQELGEE